MALIAGLTASWLYQTVRPFDFYHEKSGSPPGFHAVEMISTTTLIALLAATMATLVSGYVLRGRKS